MKATLAAIGILAGLLALGWLFTGNNLALTKYFSPKSEAVRRETFEQSKAYRQGMIQELQNMQFQYEQASPEHRDALAAIILRRAADFHDMPADLQLFINQLKTQR